MARSKRDGWPLRDTFANWNFVLRLRGVQRQLLRVATFFLLAGLLCVIADHLTPGGMPRAVLAPLSVLLALGFLGACARLLWRAAFRPLHAAFVAREIEKAHEIPHNALVSSALLAASDVPRGVRTAVDSQAIAALQTHIGVVAATGGGGRIWWLPALVVAAWLVYALLSPKPLLPSVLRLLGSPLPAPTATRIELVRPAPGDVVYAERPLELEFALSGRPADALTLELLATDGSVASQFVLPRSAAGQAGDVRRTTLAAQEVSAGLRLRARANDAVLEREIAVQPAPRVERVQIALTPPAHTAESPRVTSDAVIEVWAGTQARFTLHGNVEVRDPVLVLRGGSESRTRMQTSPETPRSATAALTLVDSGELRFEFSDAYGATATDRQLRRIVVRDDGAPTIQVTSPADNSEPIRVGPDARLSALVKDDVGIAQLELVRDREGVVSRTALPVPPPPSRSAEVGVPLGGESLAVGQVERVWLEARDARLLADGSPAPQVTRSPAFTIVRIDSAPARAEVEPDDSRPVPDGAASSEEAGATVETRERTRPGPGGEGGGDAPGPAESGTFVPASAPAASAPAEGDPNAPGAGGAGGDPAEFDDAIRRFVEQHGSTARRLQESTDGDAPQARDALPGDELEGEEQSGGGSGGGGAQPTASQPSDEGADDSAPPASAPASAPASQPTAPGTPSGNASPDSTDAPTEDQPVPADDSQPASTPPNASQPAQPSESAPDTPAAPGAAPESPAPPESQPVDKPEAADSGGGEGDPGSAPDEDAPTGDNPSSAGEAGDAMGGAPGDERVLYGNERDEASSQPSDDAALADTRGAGIDRRGEVVDVLQLLRRGEPPTDAELAALGLDAPARREFLDEFERLRDLARPATVRTWRRWQAQARPGDAKVERRGGGAQSVQGAGPITGRADSVDLTAPPEDQEIDARLRSVLDAYYRALAERRRPAQSQPTRP